jgi:hypothetical protein
LSSRQQSSAWLTIIQKYIFIAFTVINIYRNCVPGTSRQRSNTKAYSWSSCSPRRSQQITISKIIRSSVQAHHFFFKRSIVNKYFKPLASRQQLASYQHSLHVNTREYTIGTQWKSLCMLRNARVLADKRKRNSACRRRVRRAQITTTLG